MAGELILVVEDNEKNRKLVRDILTFKAGTTVCLRQPSQRPACVVTISVSAI
jgi:CheY-like chemotaxis protein